MTATSTDLRIAVAAFAARPRVLVAADFDGTLAPFVVDPSQARAVPGALEALRAASALGGVTVAIVSGRDLTTLAGLTGIGPDDGVALIGSHGAQSSLAVDRNLRDENKGDDTNPRARTNLGDDASHGADTRPGADTEGHPAGDAGFLDEGATARLGVLRTELEVIRSRYPAVRLEHKPAAVALHTRGVEPLVAAAATAAAHDVGSRHPGVHVMPGKDVVELTVLEASKGTALIELARATRSDATLYFGDDVTDERAFAALDPAAGDLTVKVGDGETAAARRVTDPESVVELLQLFVDQRELSHPQT